MKRSFAGAMYYTHGSMQLRVSFPEGERRCKYCGLCQYDGARKLYSCWATNEILLYPQLGMGIQCPLEFEEEEKDG